MEYEFLMRRVYNCGRDASKGADTDIYRKMEIAQRHLSSEQWNKTKVQRDYDCHNAFAEVRMYVRNAIQAGVAKLKFRATQQEIVKLEEIIAALKQIHFYNKEKLDEYIEYANDTFHTHGLTV